MLLVFASIGSLYLVCFLWFRSLCRAAVRLYESSAAENAQCSNLIPFERGLELRSPKTQRAM
jgi:hypothetical protein